MANRSTPLLPTDPLFKDQWHLHNTGQIPGGSERNDVNVIRVWPDYNGKGVLIAAMDDGFDQTHPDLAANYRADLSWDLTLNRPGASPVGADNNHGTAVAGLVIGVGNNSIGGLGVAWGANLIGYRTGAEERDELLENFKSYVTKLLEANAVISTNSWGPAESPFDQQSAQSGYVAGAKELTTSGRDGLGVVTLFSAGNDRAVKFNTNYDPTNNIPYAISVAASKADGLITSYSTPGASVLVTAPGSDPSSIVTTDRQGELGYNKLEGEAGNYTNAPGSEFDGTSAAAPIAAGVVALMLQANPNLGWRDVQEILVYSSKRAIFLDQARDTVSINHAKDWNGGGLATGYDFGFGNIDALAAVRLAESWQKTNTTGNLALIDGTVSQSSLTVNAGQAAQATAAFSPNNRVEQITVSVDLQTTRLQDVTLTLISPNGTRSLLIDQPQPINTEGDPVVLPTKLQYTLNTVRNWGESLQGNWTLELANAQTGDVVTLNNWSISAFSADASTGNTQVFTNEFAAFAALDPDRISISAVNGTIINAAAVSAGTVLDASGGDSSIGGNAVTLTTPDAFTGLIAGDGDDVLIGNALDNLLMGGRGNNLLDGGAGFDTAHYIGGRSMYRVEYAQDGYVVRSDVLSGGGTDRVVNIEAFSFGSTALFAKSALDQTQAFGGMYNAMFNRAADAEGLRFWTDAFFDANQSEADVALGFTQAKEAGTDELTNAEFVTRLYEYALDRSADESGYDFWMQALDSSAANRGDVLLGFVQSTEFTFNKLDMVAFEIAQLGDIWT